MPEIKFTDYQLVIIQEALSKSWLSLSCYSKEYLDNDIYQTLNYIQNIVRENKKLEDKKKQKESSLVK